jgi:arsenite methyltransferase
MSSQEPKDVHTDIRQGIRRYYGKLASEFIPEKATRCCPSVKGHEIARGGLASIIYETEEVGALPEEVTGLSAGCGDPVTLASLHVGETVLDLGAGGGIDCFLAAKRVGETGRVIGVDMTAEMIEKARANKALLEVENVEFRLGEIEYLPVADGSIDVVISNCVINLSPDKPQVIREAFRVLRPGGRLAVSDVVTNGPLPDEFRQSMAAWYGCLAGALDIGEYASILEEAGFVDVEVAPKATSIYHDDVATQQTGCECGVGRSVQSNHQAHIKVDGEFMPVDLGGAKPPFSTRITARKPHQS